MDYRHKTSNYILHINQTSYIIDRQREGWHITYYSTPQTEGIMCSSTDRNGPVEAEGSVCVGTKNTTPVTSHWIHSRRMNINDYGARIHSHPCPTLFQRRSVGYSKVSSTISGQSPATKKNTQSQPTMIIYGFDISNLRPSTQFRLFVGTIFGFNIVYAYLQELISIHIANRKYSLFISVIQFFGYAFWSYILDLIRKYNLKCTTPCPGRRRTMSSADPLDVSIAESNIDEEAVMPLLSRTSSWKSHASDEPEVDATHTTDENNNIEHESMSFNKKEIPKQKPPLYIFIGLSFIRAVDVAMTNGAMRYINYPMKTLIKSSKVAFTMLGGMVIGRKKYRSSDYLMIAMLVSGLAVFINADMQSKSILFHPLGVAMLVSLEMLDVRNQFRFIPKPSFSHCHGFIVRFYH